MAQVSGSVGALLGPVARIVTGWGFGSTRHWWIDHRSTTVAGQLLKTGLPASSKKRHHLEHKQIVPDWIIKGGLMVYCSPWPVTFLYKDKTLTTVFSPWTVTPMTRLFTLMKATTQKFPTHQSAQVVQVYAAPSVALVTPTTTQLPNTNS